MRIISKSKNYHNIRCSLNDAENERWLCFCFNQWIAIVWSIRTILFRVLNERYKISYVEYDLGAEPLWILSRIFSSSFTYNYPLSEDDWMIYVRVEIQFHRVIVIWTVITNTCKLIQLIKCSFTRLFLVLKEYEPHIFYKLRANRMSSRNWLF